MSVLEGEALTRDFVIQGRAVRALAEVSLRVAAGEFVVLTGPSGSGKSTLLNLLSGLDRPTSGDVRFNAGSLNRLSDAQVAALRNRAFGFMFQTPHVVPSKTVLENVALPCQYGPSVAFGRVRKRALALLDHVGIADLAARFPGTLSSGELQRLVFARALINQPLVLFADEPTGSLDADNSLRLLELLREQTRAGKSVVMATHDAQAMRFGTHRVNLNKFAHATAA